MKKANASSPTQSQASKLITQLIESLTDWRGPVFAQLRDVINAADPDLTEEWKWDTAVWTHQGNVCAVAAMKDHVKLNFFKGASVKDSQKLFNAGLESKQSRAIDFHEGDKINKAGVKELIRAAITLNMGGSKKK